MRVTQLVGRLLEYSRLTVEGKRLNITNPWTLYMKEGTIVLSDGERFSFDEHTKGDILRIVFFALDNCVRFSRARTSGYDWLIYPAKQSGQLGETRRRWIIETPSGIKLYADRFHPTVMAETFLYDTHYTEGLEGSTVIQAGGFNGDTALYYAQRGARVYSFEPDEQLYTLALENIALNPAIQPRITFENYALGKDGYTYPQRVERGRRAPAKRIRSLSLSTILREFRIASPTLLDLDVKGAEFELLDDPALALFEKVRIEYSPYLLGRRDLGPDTLIHRLRALGYRDIRVFKHNHMRYHLENHGTLLAVK